MRTSSEEYLAKASSRPWLYAAKCQVRTLCFTQIGTMPEIGICGWQKPVVLESFQVNIVTFLERGSMKRGWLSTPT
jgi:hypothetical protein